MRPDDVIRLRHILDAAREAVGFVRNRCREDLNHDRQLVRTTVGRTTKTITISIPPEMDKQIEQVMRAEGRTRSELLREALRRYMDERRLRALSLEIGQNAREAGLAKEEQVNELIYARRHGAE